MPKKTYKKGDFTRERILKKATQTIAKKGFDRTSIQNIAASCRISQAAAFYHFPSKDLLIQEIIKAIVVHNYQVVSGLMEITDDAYTRLLKHIQGNFKWVELYPEDAQILILLYYFASVHRKFSEMYSVLRTNAQQRILEYLLAGQREGIFNCIDAPHIVAEILHDALVGTFVNHLATQNSLNFDNARKYWETLIAELTSYRPKPV